MNSELPPPFPLNWCLSSAGCPESGLEEILTLARANGIQQLELTPQGDSTDLFAAFQRQYGRPGGVRDRADCNGVSLSVLGSRASLIGCRARHRQELLELARWSETLGVSYLRVSGGGKPTRELSAEALAEALDFLDWWEEERRWHGWRVRLLVETSGQFSRGIHCRRLQEAWAGELNLLWNTHETWRLAREAIFQTWSELEPLIRHIHFSDSVSRGHLQTRFEKVMPGLGDFPLEPFLEMLRGSHYAGYLSLEWEDAASPAESPTRSLQEALESLRAFRRVCAA